ncbi:MAG: TrkH family potassium uptake protein [Ruminococcus sp.]|nr:TrkH family potassium uptake protein [Ruminococcus sp.]
MNKSIVFHYLSKALLVGSAMFLIPSFVSLYYGETHTMLIFLIIGLVVGIVSVPLAVIKPKNKQMYAREGLVIVALLWVIYPLLGALPFYFSGEIPHFMDAVFESVSGFTTTGATILSNVEALSQGMLFWRSFTHWVGGMGVLVLMIAILPSSNHAMHLMQAECAGPQVGKIVPKGKNSAAYLYIIYAVLTLVTIVLLLLGGMPLFDSVCHAMGTAGTGGFSVKNAGIGYYNSAYIEYVLTIMMILFGVNFSLYYFILIRRFKEVFKNTELKTYFALITIATLLIMANIYPTYESLGKSFRYAFFQVGSIMTSTGFGTADFNVWPAFSQTILIVLMYIGACAGSTGGGFKVSRVIIMFKSGVKSIKKTIHPNSVNIVKSEDKALDINVVHGVQTYLIIYIFLIFISLLIVSLNGADFTTNFTSVTTCINNIGPGLNRVGPTENFGFLNDLSKLTLTVDMLLGRLECFPLLILMSPSVWRKKNF